MSLNIKRQYSLPKCCLQLEGISQSPGGEETGKRPLLSVVTQAECLFTDADQRLTGGREFLESLVRAVSRYAQEMLSGIPHPQTNAAELVTLNPSEQPGLHALTWSPPEGNSVKLELNTIQLADLVDAVDQFCADSATLPDVTLQLSPVSRRYRQADVPLTVQMQPFLTGIGSLAIASVLLFLLPIPEVKEPEAIRQETATEPTETEGEAAQESPPEAGEPPTEEPPVETAETISAADLATLLETGETISDPTEIRYIQQYIYREINAAWTDRDLPTDLSYRVRVTIDGSIVDYEPIDGTPAGADENTPLPDLEFLPTQAAIANREAVAEFKVVFTQNAVLQINPWDGYQGTPELGERIEDPDTIAELQTQLADTLSAEWDESADTLGNDLVFRVGVTADGAIADYAAENNAAFTLTEETPLPDLLDPAAAGIGRDQGSVIPQEPLAQFRVVFRADGQVEVSEFE